MNKFTLVVESEENKPTPEQEVTAAWNEYKEKNKNNTNININYEFYHEMRVKKYEGTLIISVMDKNK